MGKFTSAAGGAGDRDVGKLRDVVDSHGDRDVAGLHGARTLPGAIVMTSGRSDVMAAAAVTSCVRPAVLAQVIESRCGRRRRAWRRSGQTVSVPAAPSARTTRLSQPGCACEVRNPALRSRKRHVISSLPAVHRAELAEQVAAGGLPGVDRAVMAARVNRFAVTGHHRAVQHVGGVVERADRACSLLSGDEKRGEPSSQAERRFLPSAVHARSVTASGVGGEGGGLLDVLTFQIFSSLSAPAEARRVPSAVRARPPSPGRRGLRASRVPYVRGGPRF